MKALEYLNLVLESTGLSKDKDGYIVNKISNGDEVIVKPLMSINDLKFVYPTTKNIDTKLIDLKDKENPKVVALPFNPITESVIGEELKSHPALRKQINTMINFALYNVGSMMLYLINNDTKSAEIGTDLQMFLSTIKEGISKTVKKLIDNQSIKAWTDMCMASGEDTYKLSLLTSKKSVKEEGRVFNRIAYITFPLMEHLMSIPEDQEKIIVNGVTLRKKDLSVFKSIFRYLLPDVDESYTIRATSNDDEIPTFQSVMSLYIKVMEKIDKTGNKLVDVFETGIDTFYNPKRKMITEEDLITAKTILKELSNVPTDRDLINFRSEPELPVESIGSNMFSKPVENTTANQIQHPQMQTVVNTPMARPEAVQPQNQSTEETDIASRLNSMYENKNVNNHNFLITGNANDPRAALMNNIARTGSGMYDMPAPINAGGMYNNVYPTFNNNNMFSAQPVYHSDPRNAGMVDMGYNPYSNSYQVNGYQPNNFGQPAMYNDPYMPRQSIFSKTLLR